MPPAIPDEEGMSDAVSSEGDTMPPKKPATAPKKKGGRQPKAQLVQEEPEANGDEDEDDDDDDDDEGADEYVVEKILDHAFEKDGTCKYRVKWLGYEQEEDQTWEPEDSFDGAKDTLHKYWKQIGGKPEPKSKTPAAKGGRGKRKSVPAESTPNTASKRGKRTKTTEDPEAEADVGFNPPMGSWEDHIADIETIEDKSTDPDKRHLKVFVRWNSGHKGYFDASLLHVKCPQKLINFYESKLVFKGNDAGASADDMDA